ncbi:RHS repeat-associated core domain-containing protein [Marivirga lumbricoides]
MDYYPFGMPMAHSYKNDTRSQNRYWYNAGSRYNDSTDHYQMHYRHYDATLGRFNVVDPYANEFANLSPYNYGGNNPIMYNDPSGGRMYPTPQRLAEWADAIRGGSGGFRPGPTHSIGPGSGNHWSDGYRSVGGNAAMMSSSTFNNYYGVNSGNRSDFAASLGKEGWLAKQQSSFFNTGNRYEWYEIIEGGVIKGGATYEEAVMGPYQDNTRYFDLMGYTADQVAVQGIYLGGVSQGVDMWYNSRFDKIVNAKFTGTVATARATGNAADKAWLFATKLGSGDEMVKLAKISKIAGPVATIAGMGVSAYKIASGQGSGWDYADIGVNAAGLGASAAVTLGLISNPVGWVIGAGVLIYNGYRVYQSFTQE